MAVTQHTGSAAVARGSTRVVPRDSGSFFRRVTLWIAIGWLVLIICLALTAPLLPIRDFADSTAERLQPVGSWPEILGTDMLGRSVLSRIIYGAQTSLTIAFLSTAIAAIGGLIVGMLAAYVRGPFEKIVDILAASLLAFPGVVLLLALVSVLEPSTLTISIALSLVAAPAFMRMAKANALSQASKEYVIAAQALGARLPRVIIRELLPNTLVPMISLVAASIAIAIIVEGSISFLGFGVAPPQPSWGGLIAEGRDRLATSPHLALIPCVVLFLTVFSCNTIGDFLKTRFEGGGAKLR